MVLTLSRKAQMSSGLSQMLDYPSSVALQTLVKKHLDFDRCVTENGGCVPISIAVAVVRDVK